MRVWPARAPGTCCSCPQMTAMTRRLHQSVGFHQEPTFRNRKNCYYINPVVQLIWEDQAMAGHLPRGNTWWALPTWDGVVSAAHPLLAPQLPGRPPYTTHSFPSPWHREPDSVTATVPVTEHTPHTHIRTQSEQDSRFPDPQGGGQSQLSTATRLVALTAWSCLETARTQERWSL